MMSNNTPVSICPVCNGYIEHRFYPSLPPYTIGYLHRNYVPYWHSIPYWNPTMYWPFYREPEKTILGKATWTWGGVPTKCEIGWSHNNYMTAAVGEESPFHCGQKLKIKNISFVPSREIIVTVVDEVKKYPTNKINLHRLAFEALGVQPSAGVINVEITPVNETV